MHLKIKKDVFSMRKKLLFRALAIVLILTNLIFVVGNPSEAFDFKTPYWEFINSELYFQKYKDHTKLFISVDPRDIESAKAIFRQFLLDKRFFGKLPKEGVKRSALIIYEDNVSRYDIIDLEKRLLRGKVRPRLLKAGEHIPDRAIAGSLYTYYKYDGPDNFEYSGCKFYDSIYQVRYMDCLESPSDIERDMRYREESGHGNDGIPRTLSNYMNMESIHEELFMPDQHLDGDLSKMFGYMNLLSSHSAVQRQIVDAFFRVKLSKYRGGEESTTIDWNGLTPDFIEQNVPCIRRIFEATQDLSLRAVRRILSNILKDGSTIQEPIMLESAYRLFKKVEDVSTKEETKGIFDELLELKYSSQLYSLLSGKKFQDYVVNNWKPSCQKKDYSYSMDLENPFNNAFLDEVGELNKKEKDNSWKEKYEDYIKLFKYSPVWHKILIDAVAYKTYFLGYKSGKISKMSWLELVRDFVVCKFSLVKNILAETEEYPEERVIQLAVKIQLSVDSYAKGDMTLYNSLMADKDVSNINAKIEGAKSDSNTLPSLPPTPSKCSGWYEHIWDPSSFFNRSEDSKIFLQQFLEKIFKLNCKKSLAMPEGYFAMKFSEFLSVLAVASHSDVRSRLDAEIVMHSYCIDDSLMPIVWSKLLSKYVEPSFASIPDYIYNSFIDIYGNDLGKDIDNNDILNTKVKDDLRKCLKKIFSYEIINNEKEFKNCREELINIFNGLNSAYMQKNHMPLVTSSKPYLILSNFCIAKTLEDFQNVVYAETLKSIRRNVAQRIVDEGGPLMSKFDDNAPILFRGNCVDHKVASDIMLNGEVGTNFFLDIVRNSHESVRDGDRRPLHKNYLSFTTDINVANGYAADGSDGKIFVVLPKKNRCFCSPIFHDSARTSRYSEIDLVSTENEDILGYFELPKYKFVANPQYNEKCKSIGNNMKNIFTDGEEYKNIESINNILSRYNNRGNYDNMIETYKENSRGIIKFMVDNPAFLEKFVEYFRLNVVDAMYAFPKLAESLKKRFKRLLNKLEEDPDSIFKDTTLLSLKLLNNSSYTSLNFFPFVYRFIFDLKNDFECTFND